MHLTAYAPTSAYNTLYKLLTYTLLMIVLLCRALQRIKQIT